MVQSDNLFFSTIVGTNLYHHLISSNQLDRFLWAVGCCNHGLKQRLLCVQNGLKTHPTRLSMFWRVAMLAEIFMSVSLGINVLVLVPCLSFSWRRDYDIFLETTRKDIMVFLQLRHVNFPALLGIFFFFLEERVAACHDVSCSAGFLRCLFAMVFTPTARAWRQCMEQRHRQEESWKQFTRILAAKPSGYPGRWYNWFVSLHDLSDGG